MTDRPAPVGHFAQFDAQYSDNRPPIAEKICENRRKTLDISLRGGMIAVFKTNRNFISFQRSHSERTANWGREESLENSLNWVPKVQGESRISQAKGQSKFSLRVSSPYLRRDISQKYCFFRFCLRSCPRYGRLPFSFFGGKLYDRIFKRT